jgi:hypothetical protein
MIRKSTILSLAAAATLGVLAISTTSASAFHFGGGGGGVHFSAPRVAAPHFNVARVAAPHFNARVLHQASHVHNFAFRRVVREPRRNWHFAVRRPYWIAPVVTGVDTTYPATPATYAATPTCNCLTKQYTQDGAVVFKDLCTKEMAMNPPATPAPATLGETQPQQQGYLQPQVQPAQ